MIHSEYGAPKLLLMAQPLKHPSPSLSSRQLQHYLIKMYNACGKKRVYQVTQLQHLRLSFTLITFQPIITSIITLNEQKLANVISEELFHTATPNTACPLKATAVKRYHVPRSCAVSYVLHVTVKLKWKNI